MRVMATNEENNFAEIIAKKDDAQPEEQKENENILSIDTSLDDIDWAEPFEWEEQESETTSLLQDIAKVDWNDKTFTETQLNPSPITREEHSTEASEDDNFSNEILEILHDKFGLDNFRPLQREIINAVLNGHDCLVLIPTGGGKSLCYQLPALLTKGVTIVISPLIALIADQVDKLKARGIRAAHLCCTLPKREINKILSKLYLHEPGIDLLYVTPERILDQFETKRALNSLYSRGKLARFVLDEVHCLSLWGHDFRPHYKQLGVLREEFNDIQIVCFTATATKQVETDIIVNLKLRNVKKFIQSFNRPNIKYQVMDKHLEMIDCEIASIIRLKFIGKSGIVYCLSRKDCEDLSRYLNVMGIAAKPYHAGLEGKVREKTQREWMQNEFHVIVATIAFGMGIDKPDVRFVIHNTIPKSLEAFYQESGRAGRDGQVAYSYLFYNYDDVLRTMRLMDHDFTMKGTLDGHFDNLEQMVAFANNEVDCRRYLQLLNLGESFDRKLCMQNKETVCDNCEHFTTRKRADVVVTKQAREIAILVRDISKKNNITLNMAAKIYCGSKEKTIVRAGFHRHMYFGKGRLLTRLDVFRILRDLISRNVLEYLYLTTGDFPIVYLKDGPDLQTFLTSSDMRVIVPVAKRQPYQAMRFNREYPTLSGFMKTNLSLSTSDYIMKSIRIWCHETILDLCFKFAVERGVSVRSVLHPVAVRFILDTLPSNREELLRIEYVTIPVFNNIGEDILSITNHFRNKEQSIRYRMTVSEDSSDHSVQNISDSHKRTHSEAFSS